MLLEMCFNIGDLKMKSVVLFEDKKNCCGCGACMNICPKKAISMYEDEYGFLYPAINSSICIGCNKCKNVCSYQNTNEISTSHYSYAAVSKNDNQLIRSASGGIFAALASEVLLQKGVVYGCSMEQYYCTLRPEHIRVTDHSELYKLQGSKYVQSYMDDSYEKVKNDLKSGLFVLFSGTPCQVAALNSYLGQGKHEKLLTVDIVCHGTPSVGFFRSYIAELEKKLNGKIFDFRFRDKASGWGLKGCIEYMDSKGLKRNKLISVKLSSYYSLFLDSSTYRENCYSCKYASKHRPGDLTLGDFWGIEREHPSYLTNNGGKFDVKKGISCILVNSEHGFYTLKKYGTNVLMADSTFEKVARGNNQLNEPSHMPIEREEILNIYKNSGYKYVDNWYYKQLGFKRYIYMLWDKIPLYIQRIVKKFK